MNGSLTRVGAIVTKEFKHLGRDRRMLAAVVLLPILQLLLFAYALSFDVENVPTVVIDLDKTPTSQQYVQRYEESAFFQVVGHPERMSDVDTAFAEGTARVAVIIPAGFEQTILSGQHAEIAVLIDGSEPTSARVGRSYSVAINQVFSGELTREWAADQGLDLSAVGTLEPRLRTWYNPDHRSSDFLIPGLMVVILAIVTVQQTAVTLVRERSLGTEEQLEVSPLRKLELMIGKLIPWTLLAFVDVVLITAIGVFGLGVPLRGSVLALALGATLFILSCLGMGLAVSAVAPSEDTANIAAMMIAMLPSFLLSGFVFPLEQMPTIVQWIAYAFPARYMVALSRGVFLKGAGLTELWPQLGALALTSFLLIAISTVLYSRRARQ
ncbi:MAG: ABC transporter permease [Propionicimonas sp.]|uniref:ABC transporter permease n=1 Tax=Propionicimonas sp. TaxID=1955623 RepID=UPI002B1FC0DE|nr:ABC transporter permease [Propionicimonas sp.]MEA4945247.1 ABC transporter permease [Propionicimonas sp.]MEA5116503.1 ABC transporter permease [Propionicimonas sp.]